MLSFILPVYSLLTREIKLFYRQKSRIIGALLQPLVFWFVIGSGLNNSFRPVPSEDIGYLEYFYPGIILLVILFTSIFSTISIIEDRERGFLQGVLIAPVSRSSIVLGKILGGTTLGLFQGLLFLVILLTPLVTIGLSLKGFLLLIPTMIMIGFGLTGLGTIMAWSMKSTQGYHAIMSVFLFPMWMFSGALFPLEGTPIWLTWIMNVNPLTHGLVVMRKCFYLGASDVGSLGIGFSASVLVAFAIGVFLISTWMVRRRM